MFMCWLVGQRRLHGFSLPHNLFLLFDLLSNYIARLAQAMIWWDSRWGRNSSHPELWFSPPSEEFRFALQSLPFDLLGCLLVHCLQQLQECCVCVYAMPHQMLVGIPVDVWKPICSHTFKHMFETFRTVYQILKTCLKHVEHFAKPFKTCLKQM